jgi:hypothetical protein
MLRYDNAIECRRRPWQRRIEVYSPKIQRRLTLFSRNVHDAWVLLEADPEVRTFCERPAYVAEEAGRLIDFWVDRGRHAKFWILGGGDDVEEASFPAMLHGVAVRILHRGDMIAAEVRIKNWSQIIPYLISFKRNTSRRLQEEIFARVEKPHRLEHLEAAFQPIDVSVVRASLFTLVAEGRVAAPDIDVAPLGPTTIFRRFAS